MGCCKSSELSDPAKHNYTVPPVQVGWTIDTLKEIPEIKYIHVSTATLYLIDSSFAIKKKPISFEGFDVPQEPAFLDKGKYMWLAGGKETNNGPSDKFFLVKYGNLEVKQLASLPIRSTKGTLYKFQGRIFYLDENSNLFAFNKRGRWMQQYFNPPVKLKQQCTFINNGMVHTLAGCLETNEPNFDVFSYDPRSSEWKTHRNKFRFNLLGPVACAFKNNEVLVFGGEVDCQFSRALIKLPVQREATVICHLPEKFDGDGKQLTIVKKSLSHIAYISYPFVYYYDTIMRTWDVINLEDSSKSIPNLPN